MFVNPKFVLSSEFKFSKQTLKCDSSCCEACEHVDLLDCFISRPNIFAGFLIIFTVEPPERWTEALVSNREPV